MTEAADGKDGIAVTITLDERESRLLQRLAMQTRTTAEGAATAVLQNRLNLLAQLGPGLTQRVLTEIIEASPLAEIVLTNECWDTLHPWVYPEAGDPPPERNADGETLLANVTFACRYDTGTPFMSASFEQDRDEPHNWRAWLEPLIEGESELGDLPECLFPHETMREAADNLAIACRERFPAREEGKQ